MNNRLSIQKIVTHPGGAHKDDFLATSILAATSGAPVERREPTEADLELVECAVVDVGLLHDPELNNFDHHQFPRDMEPTCALSLVLRKLDLYEATREYCPWLEAAEWFDCRGPFETAKWLGVDREALPKLHSPIDSTLLRRFSDQTIHQPGEPVWEVMRMIGEDLLSYVEKTRSQVADIATRIELLKIDGLQFAYIPRTDPLPDEPTGGLGFYLRANDLDNYISGVVSPDSRSEGYSLRRHNDDQRLEFTQIAEEDDVHFAHARGFIAKTTATEKARLLDLLQQSIRSADLECAARATE